MFRGGVLGRNGGDGKVMRLSPAPLLFDFTLFLRPRDGDTCTGNCSARYTYEEIC